MILWRRLQDEIIHTNAAEPIRSNRANDLLVALLTVRFPRLLTDEARWALRDWLSGGPEHQRQLMEQHRVRDEDCMRLLRDHFTKSDRVKEYPVDVADSLSDEQRTQLTLFLVSGVRIGLSHSLSDNVPYRPHGTWWTWTRRIVRRCRRIFSASRSTCGRPSTGPTRAVSRHESYLNTRTFLATVALSRRMWKLMDTHTLSLLQYDITVWNIA